MIINNSRLSGTTDTRPVVIRFQVWSFYTKLKYTRQLVIISFIDIISMEIRLTILNKKLNWMFHEWCHANHHSQYHIILIALCRIVFCTMGTMGNQTHATPKLVQVYQQSI